MVGRLFDQHRELAPRGLEVVVDDRGFDIDLDARQAVRGLLLFAHERDLIRDRLFPGARLRVIKVLDQKHQGARDHDGDPAGRDDSMALAA